MFTRTLASHFARSVLVTSLVATAALSHTAYAQPVGNLQQYTDVMVSQVSGNTRSAIVNDARQAVANAAFHFDVNNQPNVRANITMYDLANNTDADQTALPLSLDTAALTQRIATQMQENTASAEATAPRFED